KAQGEGSRRRLKAKAQGEGSRRRLKAKAQGEGSRRRLKAKGEPIWPRYDPPWKPWYLCTNEIQLEVTI
ncbi:MAG: hypothetical protein ACOZQL_42130, partial [Myxococcota bacterium]